MHATRSRSRVRPMLPLLCRGDSRMKRALITGGARGIGLGIAEAMLAADYDVTVTGLTADEVAAVPKRDRLRAVPLDVTDDMDVAACIARLDRLDALVNCAGIILRDGQEFTV